MSDSLGVLCTACVDVELVNERRLPPASLASKMKDYVSPYAQSGESKSALSVRFSNVFIIIISKEEISYSSEEVHNCFHPQSKTERYGLVSI